MEKPNKSPLFVLMSGKRKGDYKKVFKKIKTLIMGEIQFQKMVADFEAAVWRACMTVFPHVRFHNDFSTGVRLLGRKLEK